MKKRIILSVILLLITIIFIACRITYDDTIFIYLANISLIMFMGQGLSIILEIALNF